MQMLGITNILEQRNARRVVLLCHVNADPDAICSALAFSHLLQALRPPLDVEIVAASGPSRLSKFLLQKIPVKLADKPRIEDAEVIVLLDTNTIQQLGEFTERVGTSRAAIIIIDHHAIHPTTERLAALNVTDERASSTCEIVYRLFREAQVPLNQNDAKALFLGIAFDTRHFVLANSSTFKVVADLIDSGIRAEDTLPILSLPMHLSERIARLKAARRSRLIQINNWIISFSQVSAYQASAARALIALGADVAIVAGKANDRIQVSMRTSQEFHGRTSIHLGRDIAKPLGEFLQGAGGGHAISAGVNGVGDVEASFKCCIRLLQAKLTAGNNS